MSNFQTILLVVFGVLIFVAVLIFSGVLPGIGPGSKDAGLGGEVQVWGTLPESSLSKALIEFNSKNKTYSIKYFEKNEKTFDRELVEALASGFGPDVILLPQELIVRHADKIYSVSFESYSERSFKNTFIEGGEIYLTKTGTLAVPFTIDPIVMYWNRDMFSQASIVNPPKNWEDFLTLAPALTKKDGSSNISKSAISFGAYSNVMHAKDIIAMLMLQTGNPIISRGNGGLSSAIAGRTIEDSSSSSALRFYSDFSNSVKEHYSWNSSLSNSRNAFIAGNLAVYFGYASEASALREANPHLNMDVAVVPQIKGSERSTTFGRMQGLAVLKSSDNINTAFASVSAMSGQDVAGQVAQSLSLPPVRRDLLAKKPGDAYEDVFYDSALMARSWLDPSPSDTNVIFSQMVDDVTSGRMKAGEALSKADGLLNRLLNKQI